MGIENSFTKWITKQSYSLIAMFKIKTLKQILSYCGFSPDVIAVMLVSLNI